jgi:hypothetical protein
MHHTLNNLDQARVNVWESELRIAQQRRRIAERAEKGFPTEESQRFLACMITILDELCRLRDDISKT